MHTERIIGQRTGATKGPLLIILAQIHGNEPSGFEAAKGLFEAIDAEYGHKSDFDFCGRIVALRGNVAAAKIKARYINKDMNRNWTSETFARIAAATDDSQLDSEDLETRALDLTIRQIIADYPTDKVVVLDLHTTTAEGGLFSIPSHSATSRRLALAMYAPVLHGFLRGLAGTSLHYFTPENFGGIDITPVCFEAGQHDSPDSPKLAMSAIINCFKAMGGFYEADVELRHEELLRLRAQDLLREGRLIYTYSIKKGEQFEMRKDKIYKNFDYVEAGELLAHNQDGEIFAPHAGHILMPLYQKLGSDGFFIVEEMSKMYRRPDEHYNHQTAAF